ncbi:MAG: chromosomal replication initiator protein DnaA [Vampirovibrionales bacterium]|nr:chromosomal replication initiator protein DnaA [Vampirovibrionales bacterium]
MMVETRLHFEKPEASSMTPLLSHDEFCAALSGHPLIPEEGTRLQALQPQHMAFDNHLEPSCEAIFANSLAADAPESVPAMGSYRQKALPARANDLSMTDLWRAVLAELQAELSAPSFETWIRPLTLIRIEGGEAELLSKTAIEVILGVPSPFHRDWVLRHYRAALVGVLSRSMSLLWPHHDTTIAVAIVFNIVAQDGTLQPAENQTLPLLSRSRAGDTAFEGLTEEENASFRLAAGQNSRRDTPRAVIHDHALHAALNPRYSFENFVVGAANRFAHAACQAVADHPGEGYNPLFLYGGVGLGKTHLAQAVGHHVITARPNAIVRYLTAEQFTNDMIDALSRKQMSAFRDRYRRVDVLILEDIQFLEGKERTQEEVFHTFNALHQAGKQIVLTSDGHPKRLSSLAERLRSRFEMGLIADVQPIDLETRMAILRQKSRRDGLFTRLAFSTEGLALIAERHPANMREIEGALNKVAAYAMLHAPHNKLSSASIEVSASLVQSALGHSLNPDRVCANRILQTVARYYHLDAADLQGPSRLKDITHARQMAIYLMRSVLMLSFQKIGNILGNRGHSTIMHAYERFRSALSETASGASALRRQLEEVQHQLPH